MKPDTDSAPFSKRAVAGVPFHVASVTSVAEWLVRDAAPNHIAVNVRLANAYNIALSDSDPSYFDTLTTRGVNFPDGTPVVWFMNQGADIEHRASRVRGPSVFEETLRRSNRTPIRHFLLGSTPETLALLDAELRRRFAEINIVGSYSPPFADITDEYVRRCADRVRETSPDIVWLGLGTPKQDLLGTALSDATGLTTVNVGAAFDFVAGTVREAPTWIQNSGMEWLFRLASEPRRLWRRYLFGNFRFLRAAMRKHPSRHNHP